MKRGTTEQTFIFIFALIVAAMIMVWGTKTILDLKGRACQIEIADSIEDIKEKAITYYNLEAESKGPLQIRFPAGVDCTCFLDLNPDASKRNPTSVPSGTGMEICKNDLQFDNWRINEKNNNILVTLSGTCKKSVKITKFKTIQEFVPAGENPLCFNLKSTNGILKAYIEAKGDHVIIKR